MLCTPAGFVQVKVASLVDSVQQLSRTPGFSAMLKDIDMSNTVRQLWEKVSEDGTLLGSTQLQSALESCWLQAAGPGRQQLSSFLCAVWGQPMLIWQKHFCSTHA